MRIVHGANASPFVRKVRVALAEKGLAYELKPIFPFNVSAEYKKISPLGKIPAYEEDGKTLADSSVICAYLERAHPEPALYPSDPYEYGRARLWWTYFASFGQRFASTSWPAWFMFTKCVQTLMSATEKRVPARASGVLIWLSR